MADSKGPAPEPYETTLVANAVHCLDDDETWEVNDDEPTTCYMDAGHATEPLFVTQEPLGYDNDRECYHHGNKRYEYYAAERD